MLKRKGFNLAQVTKWHQTDLLVSIPPMPLIHSDWKAPQMKAKNRAVCLEEDPGVLEVCVIT